MSRGNTPKVQRQIIRKILRKGVLDVEEAQAEFDEKFERWLEKEEQKKTRRQKRGREKDWDDNGY